ncbi:unnamed protein product [Heligmosomoides polygyrus]|uniref:Dimer_Tnp_hAT domain-containing protein n=1 Tax=Heligmosomoides polygyrus TaxID=6339 RepID=A0A3P7YC33_HELPZ|nr:unnamed protein product [Heligmosomoides polygyrus]
MDTTAFYLKQRHLHPKFKTFVVFYKSVTEWLKDGIHGVKELVFGFHAELARKHMRLRSPPYVGKCIRVRMRIESSKVRRDSDHMLKTSSVVRMDSEDVLQTSNLSGDSGLELGTTKPGRRKVDKQTWLWTDDEKAKVREKKSLYHVFLGDRTADNCGFCSRSQKSSVHDHTITEKETEAALKPGRATGPDDLAADVWKSKLWYPAEWLAEFFNQVVKGKKVPECWHNSTTIPIWKKKGDPADCSNYRRILLHSMKICKRIPDRRIREIVMFSDNQSISGTELARTSVFKYLGSAIASDGGLMTEVNSRVSATWSKWRSLTGMLCNTKIPVHMKSRIYRAVVRLVAMYNAECWPATKEDEMRLSVIETKMLRWTAGVTRMDRIRNDVIRQKFGVAPIADKMREARLRPPVLRRKDSIRTIGLEMEVPGKRLRGRPKQRWSDTLHMDMKVIGVHYTFVLFEFRIF